MKLFLKFEAVWKEALTQSPEREKERGKRCFEECVRVETVLPSVWDEADLAGLEVVWCRPCLRR